jgi:Glycogen recognition site of AMP-activated protein kinase
MEVTSAILRSRMAKFFGCILFLLILVPHAALAQKPVQLYTIKDGKMHIELSKHLSTAGLDSFISKHDLFDLDIKTFLKTNNTDSLKKLGWVVDKNDLESFVLSKSLLAYDKIKDPESIISFTEKFIPESFLNNNPKANVPYGYNQFKNKDAFAVKDSIVTFFLRNNQNAKQVFLAGTFNKWKPTDLLMSKTDSGWIANVKLNAGKHFYKFIIDGNWVIDNDNKLNENDGEGNTNSAFYFTNTNFKLNGFTNAKKIYVAGSFNNWQEDELKMIRTATGWELPLYLANGTHTYRFIVDGKWFTDPENTDKFPNEFNDFNSVIRMGKSYLFTLEGYTDAKKVVLSGSFNVGKPYELVMTKTATGWELPYALAAGNYEYHFEVDGKVVIDSSKINENVKAENAILIIEPNYTFRLKGFDTAHTVYLAGDFNNWSPKGFTMKREGTEWVLPVHLSTGKHLYKLVVDEKWITDPDNLLWEENEFSTGNSVLWFVE